MKHCYAHIVYRLQIVATPTEEMTPPLNSVASLEYSSTNLTDSHSYKQSVLLPAQVERLCILLQSYQFPYIPLSSVILESQVKTT